MNIPESFEFYGEWQRPCKKDWKRATVRVSGKDVIAAVLGVLQKDIREHEETLKGLRLQLTLAERGILTPPYI